MSPKALRVLVLGGISIAIGLSTVQHASAEVCVEWNVSGDWRMFQSNGADVALTLRQRKDNKVSNHISGKASFSNQVGGVTGAIARDGVSFQISWSTGKSVGVYDGSIDKMGMLTGSTYDKMNPKSRATWKILRAMQCVKYRKGF